MKNILPADFLWGDSVSNMQTEGAWNEGGKRMSVYDIRQPAEFASDWKVATDSYRRFREDFDLIQDLGMNCYRFQIARSRVCPEGDGEFNEEGIVFYHQFVDELIARGIEPMICLYHFDMPLSLAERYNGFTNRRVMGAFTHYGQKVIDCHGDKVKYWLTFSEQNLYRSPEASLIAGYLRGDKTLRELYQIQHHVMVAHVHLTHYLHQAEPQCLMGEMLAHALIYPVTCRPRDILCARQPDEFLNQNLLRAYTDEGYSPEVMYFVARQGFDGIYRPEGVALMATVKVGYLVFGYYTSRAPNSDAIPPGTAVNNYMLLGNQGNPHLKATEWDWRIDPLEFRMITARYYSDWRLPMFPIENGIGMIKSWNNEHPIADNYRVAYHRDHINAMKTAVFKDGAQVVGYLGQGLINILSSQGNMRERYGMMCVNRENHDLKDLWQVPKKSYARLKQVIHSNGEAM